MQLSPVHNADLPSKSKCRLVPELFSISAPVAVQSYVPWKEFVVFTAPIQISIAHQNRRNCVNYDNENQRITDTEMKK
jgi:hypothetical protein